MEEHRYLREDEVMSSVENAILIPKGTWESMLALKGFELQKYADPKGDLGWSAYVEVHGLLLGFVDEQGNLFPHVQLRSEEPATT